jgi:NADPH-dependent 2,4-dienoyl-CoA reductase/sulfur reductase-like enzyme/Pyruvate/2-oxoacid:ferredoxin oxidoreductase delta subunit/bacterioferritin-associated ferredoxin
MKNREAVHSQLAQTFSIQEDTVLSSEDHQGRINRHPVIDPLSGRRVHFFFNGEKRFGIEGEAVSSALFANHIHTFGHHSKDKAAQGIFCANGQCSQCTLIIDGLPRKSCIIPLTEGMKVLTVEGTPQLPDQAPETIAAPEIIETDVLILGAGPSGMAAALELGKRGVSTVLIDDKDRLGGKLVLQTHKFFGSVEDCYAGTRGVDIATRLGDLITRHDSVDIWLNSVVIGIFSDKTVGIRRLDSYKIVKPRCLLVSAGAREKSLPFPGNALPGVYGAGAFQTLVNRDLVRPAERLLIVGGGNVGLIGAYHALQADLTVVGLVEAMPVCGGYKVHADKIRRLGVPIYTGHTILAAHGEDHVEAVTISEIDPQFRPVPGTEKSFAVDTVLIAVGLDPVNEFTKKARQYNFEIYQAGDAEEIAEASAAMFSGKIRGLEIARALGATNEPVSDDWTAKAEILKSPGGDSFTYTVPDHTEGVYPVIHCFQEIPCNPCVTSCPKNLISTKPDPIMGIPRFCGVCVGCEQCVGICPGLAITLVDWRKSADKPIVTVPFEFGNWLMTEGDEVTVTDWEGEVIGTAIVKRIKEAGRNPKTWLLKLETDGAIANRVAGVRIQDPAALEPMAESKPVAMADESIICRCERVTAGEIRQQIREGVCDMNELKVRTRAGFGACGGKTCKPLIARICREEGFSEEQIVSFTARPLFAETQLGYFSGRKRESE